MTEQTTSRSDVYKTYMVRTSELLRVEVVEVLLDAVDEDVDARATVDLNLHQTAAGRLGHDGRPRGRSH